MNKPCGVVCSAVSDSHKTIYDLLPLELQKLVQNAKRGERLHTVGRLDCNTSGLILITNDGYFSNRMTNPDNSIQKVYKVKLQLNVPENTQKMMINQFKNGIILPAEKKYGEQQAKSAKLEFISQNECFVTVTEGKFHEIRRMFTAFNNIVEELKRIKFGEFELPQTLEQGHFLTLKNI